MQGNENENEEKGKEEKGKEEKDKKTNQYKLWYRFFNLNDKIFKKKQYDFNYTIKTDGISVSILFVRLDENEKPIKYNPYQTPSNENIKYIEDVKITDEFKSKKVVCIDPNYSDLIYCGSKDENDNLQTEVWKT